MVAILNNNKQDRLIAKLSRLWKDEQKIIKTFCFDERYRKEHIEI